MKNYLTLTFLLFISVLSYSQKYKIQGFVADSGGMLLNAASVTITGTKFQNKQYTLLPNGWFELELLPGTYDITAEFPGRRSARKTVTIIDKDIYVSLELQMPTPSSRLDKDTLIIGMVYDPPMFWFKERDSLTTDTLGIAYELARLLEMELKKKFEYRLCGYLQSDSLLQEGYYDLLIGGFIPSLSYKKKVLWSIQFMQANFRLIVPIGSPIRTLDDLKKSDSLLVVGHYDEPVVNAWIKANLPNAKRKGYEVSDWYKFLQDGEINVIINEYPYAKESIKPYKNVLEFTSEQLNHQGYAICIPPEDYRLLDQVNTALEKIMKTKSFKKAYKQYLDAEVPPLVKTPILTSETDFRRYPTRRIYTVQSGDSLQSIAKRYLGNEAYWKEIRNLNIGDRKLNGLVTLIKGSQLRLPVKIERN